MAYRRAYGLRHRERLREYAKRHRKEKWPIYRVKIWFRKKYRRITNPAGLHAVERRHMLKKKYGLTQAEYDAMLAEQGGVCAICHRPEKRTNRPRYLCVDHDHETGEIRELLCHACNTALGAAGDNPETLRAMIGYLAKHTKRREE